MLGNTVLTEKELDLLSKLGIKLPTKKTSFEQKVVKDHRTKTTDLSPYSAKITRNCACCGKTSITYADYIKRVNHDGFAMRTVDSPSNQVMRFHTYSVLSCKFCNDEAIKEATQEELIEMINRLREKVIDVQCAQRLTGKD